MCRALSGGREATFTAPLPDAAGCNGQRQRRRERQLESVAFIGQGADANVYLVRCKLTGRMSALKVRPSTGSSSTAVGRSDEGKRNHQI